MDSAQRRLQIQDTIQRDGYVRLSALSEKYGVAPVTIHRDLDFLAGVGAVERIRGGARRPGLQRREIMSDFVQRRAQASEQKVAIAKRALSEIADGSTVFFDSSTTVLALALELENALIHGLTVVTNSPAIADQIHAPSVHVIVAPGELNQSLKTIAGRWTVEFLANLSIATAFVSAAGITIGGGMMTAQRELAEITKVAFSRSERRVVLADSTKFDTSALMTMGTLDQLDLVVTDDLMPDDVFERYRSAGLTLERVGVHEELPE